MKVLVVDDSRVMRNMHKNALIEHNVKQDDILEAGDGGIALEVSIKNPIDLFLVDWNMPGLNGLEFVKAIRALEKYKSTPIIMITSEAAKYMVVEAINAGVTNYIVKPVSERMLWEKLSRYLI
jgi:two-component system, chemotaxis family, chemotaxis protein CheY